MIAADRVIMWTIALAVSGVAAVALVGSYELLMMVIRNSQAVRDGVARSLGRHDENVGPGYYPLWS